ncbi:bacterio-opsin activator domain-containing protein [Natrinema soli]|uniref:Bacterio-opsin activator domain-containing protein n=1 Tax=Natrinema soli TaxID=1930624 RepID=A0ABD5SMW1_9EURY|nr:bacterio-opsin activator domain-containing protein [Natrinema soli]
MSVIAEFSVPTEEFALAQTLSSAPEMTVEIERVVAHSEDRVMPFFWILGGNYTEFETAINADPSVQNVTRLDELDQGTLYRAEWTRNIESIIYAYTEIGATIIEATGRADAWELRMRFDDEDLLSNFQDYCLSNDISFTLQRLYHPSEPMAGGQFGLSPKQRTALVTALEHGYFNIPRKITMGELAETLDISQQSLSKRFRRAHRNLITNVLTISHPDDENSR